MREIRFRAWGNNGEGMNSGLKLSNDTYTHMLSTGMKDRNGVEIYEGDVVMCNGTETETVLAPSHGLSGIYRSKPVRAPFTVEWHQSFACWSFANSKVSIAPDVSKRDYEVIGNIYQNPELTEPQ